MLSIVVLDGSDWRGEGASREGGKEGQEGTEGQKAQTKETTTHSMNQRE